MSMTLMVKAMHLKVGNPIKKLVLLKLADNAGDSGECWPSYQHIADQCEIGKSTVRKHVKELEEMGLLRIEARPGPKGNSSNVYHLTLDGCHEVTGGVSPDSTPVSPDSTGGVSPDSTRISHSFDPVSESKEMPSSAKNDAVPYEKIRTIFNEVMPEPFPRVKVLSTARKTQVKKLFGLLKKDVGKVQSYFQYFADNCSDFHKGENDRGWVAEFDYIIREATLIKAQEGTL